MKVLVVGMFYTEGFALHIAETLAGMGHEVSRFEPGSRTGPANGKLSHRINQIRGVLYGATDGIPVLRSWRTRGLWEAARVDLDLILVCHDFLWPVEVAELKQRTGAAIAMWFPDALVNFGRGFFMNAPYDALFFKDPFIPHAMKDVLKIPVHYLPECFNPDKHSLPEESLVPDPIYACDLTLAGNSHSWRLAFLEHLAGYDIKLWGNPPPLWSRATAWKAMHQGRGVFNHEKVRAFRGAKVVLSNLHFGEIWGLSARCFEAAGAGAFQLVDWRPGLAQLFVDGAELISFSCMSDLRRKIDYWLPRDLERKSIAEAGQRRAKCEHTYTLRLELMINTLKGNAQGFPLVDVHSDCFS